VVGTRWNWTMSKYFLIDEDQVARLERLMKRLYTENRMNGDEMRDAAHTINAVVSTVRQLPCPDDEPAPEQTRAELERVTFDCLRRWVRAEQMSLEECSLLLSAGFMRRSEERGFELTEHGEMAAKEKGFLHK
jgi:hypothetical protein